MTAIDRARDLLAAARRKPCGHSSFYTCEHCEGRRRAHVWFEGSGFTPATLAVTIKLVQAHLERPPSEHDGGCCAGISKLPCECSAKDRKEALAEWEKLLP